MTRRVVQKCRHRDSWILGFVWEWCYRCGALRRLSRTGPTSLAVDSGWQRPVGQTADNPGRLPTRRKAR